MVLLEKIIKEKLLNDIIELVNPLEAVALRQNPDNLEHHPLPILPILINEIILEKEFRQDIHQIKLNYYKRNLLVLEKILEKQNTLDNTRLALKIVRENLGLKNISSFINYYNLYHTYKNRSLYKYKTKEFILQEPQEYYKMERYINSINIE